MKAVKIGLSIVLPFFLSCHDPGVTVMKAPEVKKPDITQPDVVTPELLGPSRRADMFKQRTAMVDILWVVDNSPSMVEEQDNLASNFDHFVSFMSQTNVDFHIGVISTDMKDAGHSGKLRGNPSVITTETPDMVNVFSQNVHVGTGGGAMEQGLAAMHSGLTEPLLSGANAGFIRPDASLFVIAVSDEDDASFGPVHYFERFLEGYKGAGNSPKVNFSSIMGDVPDGCATARPGARYAELVQLTGGITASICSEDFGVTLEGLGFTAAGLIRVFPLSTVPVTETLAVWVDDVQVQNDPQQGWQYDGSTNSVVFSGSFVPPSGSTIKVEYKIAQ